MDRLPIIPRQNYIAKPLFNKNFFNYLQCPHCEHRLVYVNEQDVYVCGYCGLSDAFLSAFVYVARDQPKRFLGELTRLSCLRCNHPLLYTELPETPPFYCNSCDRYYGYDYRLVGAQYREKLEELACSDAEIEYQLFEEKEAARKRRDGRTIEDLLYPD